MKAITLISTALLAFSLAGAVQAKDHGPVTSNSAPTTIVLAHCDANNTANCGINSNTPAAKTNEVDLNSLPPADPKQQHQQLPADPKQQHQQAQDPATPVPEPSTFVMLMLGLVVLGFASRRQQTTEIFVE